MTLPRNMPLEDFINLPDLLARVDNDRELLEEIAGIFKEEFPRLRNELQSAVLCDDMAQAEQLAHALKGMLLNLSVDRGAAAAADIERHAKAGDIAQVGKALAAFDGALSGLLPALEAYIADVPL